MGGIDPWVGTRTAEEDPRGAVTRAHRDSLDSQTDYLLSCCKPIKLFIDKKIHLFICIFVEIIHDTKKKSMNQSVFGFGCLLQASCAFSCRI